MAEHRAPVHVRPCRLGDLFRIRRLLKKTWIATYVPIMGEEVARERERIAFSYLNLVAYILSSNRLGSPIMLVAARDDVAEGVAYARMDSDEIVLYLLYVDPDRQGMGIGSSLLQAVCDRHPGAKAVRLEVLKANVSAIAWYKTRGFEAYGNTANASGMNGIPSIYMDKKLDGTVAMNEAEQPC